jgi:hypothetical protein
MINLTLQNNGITTLKNNLCNKHSLLHCHLHKRKTNKMNICYELSMFLFVHITFGMHPWVWQMVSRVKKPINFQIFSGMQT